MSRFVRRPLRELCAAASLLIVVIVCAAGRVYGQAPAADRSKHSDSKSGGRGITASPLADGAMKIATQGIEPKSKGLRSSQTGPGRPTFNAPVHIVPFVEPGSAGEFAVAGAHENYYGGPVISNVHVIQVLYGTGSYLSNVSSTTPPSVASFFTDITQSALFDMLSEYSTAGILAFDGTPGTSQTIGHGFFDGQVAITPAAANNGTIITDAQIQAELLEQVAAGTLPPPQLDAQNNNNTLYMIYFPPGKTIKLGNDSSCVINGFCAYHSTTTATFGSQRLLYGVLPDMQSPSACSTGCGGGASPFDIVTNVTSHELSEAVTDADVGVAPSLARPLAWMDPNNGEIGDICMSQEATIFVNGHSYVVQTEFSNFQNDCVAGPPQIFAPAGLTVTPGQNFDLQVSVQSNQGANLSDYTGTLHFTSSDPKAALPADYTFTSADAGFHTFVVSLGTPGAQTITIADTRLAILRADRPFTVVATDISHFSIAQPANVTQGIGFPVTVAARDSNNFLVPDYAGTIHFTSGDSAAVLPPNATLTNGIGNFTVTFNSTGTQTITAADIVNAQIFGSVSSFVSALPPNPSTTTVVASLNPSTFGQSVTFTATVTQQNGMPAPFGSMVNFTQDGVFFNSGVVNLNGNAVAPITTNMQGGSHVIFADYVGSSANNVPASSSAPLSVTVNPAATTDTLSSSLPTSVFGNNVNFTAQLASPGGQPTGGFVTFFDGSTPLAVVSPSFGSAGFGDTSLSVGTHTITATYSGNANFAASSSGPVTQVVKPAPPPDYTVASNQSSATLLAGQSSTFLITANSLNGFDGTINFSCGNLPALATCNFTFPSLSVNPQITQASTALTFKTAGPHASLFVPPMRAVPSGRREARLWMAWPFVFGVTVLLMALSQKRRRAYVPMLFLLLTTFLVSCGGGSGPPPPPPPPPTTPPGTTTIVVSATGTATPGRTNPANPNQQINITITVQP